MTITLDGKVTRLLPGVGLIYIYKVTLSLKYIVGGNATGRLGAQMLR